MAKRQDVLYYAPTPPPQKGDAELIRWIQVNLDRIADNFREGRSQQLRMDVKHDLPPRPRSGDLAWFAAGIAGATEGLYEYRGTSWQKL